MPRRQSRLGKPGVPQFLKQHVVDVAELTGCWHWPGSKNKDGYGRVWLNKTYRLAHRYSWEFHNGAIPSGLCVCHHCDNPACVNPAHLFLGTHRENIQDAVRKGRMRPQRMPGERHPNAKLTEEQVAKIRFRTKYKTMSRRELAESFGVSWSAIAHVQKGRGWNHV